MDIGKIAEFDKIQQEAAKQRKIQQAELRSRFNKYCKTLLVQYYKERYGVRWWFEFYSLGNLFTMLFDGICYYEILRIKTSLFANVFKHSDSDWEVDSSKFTCNSIKVTEKSTGYYFYE